jgi:4-hydroxy-tetrahydrodipicolinate reductase
VRVGINGIAGRMGRALLRILLERGHEVGAGFEAPSSSHLGASLADLHAGADSGVSVRVINEDDLKTVEGLIDFSVPESTLALIDIIPPNRLPVVIGTTGFTPEQLEKIETAAGAVPILFSPNMSVGVNLLFRLTDIASRALLGEYDVEVFEAHHRFKKDAPSGTARKIVEIVKNAVPALNGAAEIYGRQGIVGERADAEIGVMAMRGGDIVGEHTVFFIGREERIELTHRAASRDTFARGAVRAIEYMQGKQPGLYTMFDVLGL